MRRGYRLPQAKKRFGQHFLHDGQVVARIVEAVRGGGPGCVVEIGPGCGALTAVLAPYYPEHYWALEVDRDLYRDLQGEFPCLGDRLVLCDCLQYDFAGVMAAHPEGFQLVGNLPYNISSQVLMRLVYGQRERVPRAVFMLQREVGERIASGPGGRVCGVLSVLLQAFYHVKVLFGVPPGAFTPPPRVDSVVVQLERIEGRQLDCPVELFTRVVKASFGTRRKTLRNSLTVNWPFDGAPNLPLEMPYGAARAEQLGVQEYVELTRFLMAHRELKFGSECEISEE